GKAVIKYGDVEVRLGADGKAAHSLVPPSTTDGFTREWDVSLEDCDPVELPESVVDKLLAAVAKRPHEASKERPSDDEFTQEFREHVRSGLPGNDFNQRGEWANILVPKGW